MRSWFQDPGPLPSLVSVLASVPLLETVTADDTVAISILDRLLPARLIKNKNSFVLPPLVLLRCISSSCGCEPPTRAVPLSLKNFGQPPVRQIRGRQLRQCPLV